jgi:hypothetical protein
MIETYFAYSSPIFIRSCIQTLNLKQISLAICTLSIFIHFRRSYWLTMSICARHSGVYSFISTYILNLKQIINANVAFGECVLLKSLYDMNVLILSSTFLPQMGQTVTSTAHSSHIRWWVHGRNNILLSLTSHLIHFRMPRKCLFSSSGSKIIQLLYT